MVQVLSSDLLVFVFAPSWSVSSINRLLYPQGLYILLISSVFNAADTADDSNDSDDEFQICQICSGEDVLYFNLDSLIFVEG